MRNIAKLVSQLFLAGILLAHKNAEYSFVQLHLYFFNYSLLDQHWTSTTNLKLQVKLSVAKCIPS